MPIKNFCRTIIVREDSVIVAEVHASARLLLPSTLYVQYILMRTKVLCRYLGILTRPPRGVLKIRVGVLPLGPYVSSDAED